MRNPLPVKTQLCSGGYDYIDARLVLLGDNIDVRGGIASCCLAVLAYIVRSDRECVEVRDLLGIREPVKAYEYMGRFYVEEGNKRVSVMKYVGAYSIPTHVIRCLPKKTNDRDVQIYYEYLPFYEVTGIFGFTFTREGCFEKLAALLGRDLVKPWPETLGKE